MDHSPCAIYPHFSLHAHHVWPFPCILCISHSGAHWVPRARQVPSYLRAFAHTVPSVCVLFLPFFLWINVCPSFRCQPKCKLVASPIAECTMHSSQCVIKYVWYWMMSSASSCWIMLVRILHIMLPEHELPKGSAGLCVLVSLGPLSTWHGQDAQRMFMETLRSKVLWARAEVIQSYPMGVFC